MRTIWKNVLWALCSVLCLAIAGCGDGPKEKVVGVWKSESPNMLNGLPEFLVIEAGKLGNGRGETIDIVIEDKDGKAVIRKAGLDQPLFIITVADDKSSITVDAQGGFGGTEKFVASSNKELQETFYPSPDKIIGLWKRAHTLDDTQYFSILELSKNSLTYNGQKEEIKIQSGNGEYRFTNSELLRGGWRLTEDGALRSGNALTGTATFTRSSPEEAKELLAAREKLPERIVGLWREEALSSLNQPGKFDAPVFHEITPTELVVTRGGQTSRQTIALTLTEKGIAITAPDGTVQTIVNMSDPDVITFSRPGSMFGPDATLIRVTEEQRDQTLTSHAAAGEAVIGVWKKQSGRDIPDHPFLVVTNNALSLSGKEEQITLTGKGSGILAQGEKNDFTLTPSDKGITLRGSSLSYAENGEYVRSSQEEMEQGLAELAALPDAIIGYWRSKRGNRDINNYIPLAITRESFSYGGKDYPITITPQRDGKFVLGDDTGKYADAAPQKDGSIYFTPTSVRGEAFVPATQAEYEALKSGKRIFPREFQGYWLGEKPRNNKIPTLFLREGDIVRNGFQEATQAIPDGESLTIVRADNHNYKIASVAFHGDANRINVRFERGSVSYKRVEREEFEAAYKLNFFVADLVWGNWITQAVGGRQDRPAALTFVKGDGSGWPVRIDAFGFSKKGAPDKALGGYFDINADGVVLIRTGNNLDMIYMEFELKDRNTLEVKSSFYNSSATFSRASAEQVLRLKSGQ